jgi:hypothetical protein
MSKNMLMEKELVSLYDKIRILQQENERLLSVYYQSRLSVSKMERLQILKENEVLRARLRSLGVSVQDNNHNGQEPPHSSAFLLEVGSNPSSNKIMKSTPVISSIGGASESSSSVRRSSRRKSKAVSIYDEAKKAQDTLLSQEKEADKEKRETSWKKRGNRVK